MFSKTPTHEKASHHRFTLDVAWLVAEGVALKDLAVEDMDQQLDLLLLGAFGSGGESFILRFERFTSDAFRFNWPAASNRWTSQPPAANAAREATARLRAASSQ